MSAAPIFYVTPRQAGADCTAAAANAIKLYLTADNLALVIAGAAGGSMIQRVTIVQTGVGASTANNIARFFLNDGTGYNLVHEANIGASITSSATVAGPRITVPELVGMKLPDTTWKLYVGFSVIGTVGTANVYRITAEVADA